MNRDETIELFQKLSTVYPQHYSKLDQDQKKTLVKEWESHFGAYTFDEVEKVVDEHIKNSQFNPSIYDIRLRLKDNEQSLAEQWNGAYKCLKCEDTGFVGVEQEGKADIAYFCDCELGKLKSARQMEDHAERHQGWRTRMISEVEQ